MVNVVRPTGGLTPARPDAMVRVGNQLQGLFWRAGSSYGERVEWRIQRWRWRRLGWPGAAPATRFAAAGVGRERGRGCVGRGDVRLAPTASTWCGEYDGRMPGTKWSPEHHHRRALAAALSGERGAVAMAC